MPRRAANAWDRVAASRQVLMAAGLRFAARRLRRQLSIAARSRSSSVGRAGAFHTLSEVRKKCAGGRSVAGLAAARGGAEAGLVAPTAGRGAASGRALADHRGEHRPARVAGADLAARRLPGLPTPGRQASRASLRQGRSAEPMGQ